MQLFNKKIIYKLLFLITVFFGVFLYFYKLGEIPAGFYIDEALPGYNAYSILLTGKDEYGKVFPLVFRFYGSFNPPLYTYLTVIPVWLLGLSVFSVRFISSLAGFLTAIVIYFLIKESGLIKEKWTSLISLPLILISPWLLLHSRVGYEVSLGLLLFSLGVVFSWRAINKKKSFYLGFLFLSASTYAAYAERFLVPFFLVGFFLIFKKRLLKERKKDFIKAMGVTFLTQIPNFYLLSTPAFFPKEELFGGGVITYLAQKGSLYLPYQISLGLSYLREFLSQYATYFSPQSLFYLPDPDSQRSIPELSTFYFWMVIPYLVGLYALWRERKEKFSKLIWLLLLISPIPAALTKDPFSTHRAMPLFMPIVIVIAVGIDRIIKALSPKFLVTIMILAFAISGIFLWRSYFVFLPNERSEDWMYGVEELSAEIKKRPDTKFLIDQARSKPLYANLAFFIKYPPDKFQEETDQKVKENYYHSLDFSPDYEFGNIETRSINWEIDPCEDKMIVGDNLAISEKQAEEHSLEKVFEITGFYEDPIFVGYKTNPSEACKNI